MRLFAVIAIAMLFFRSANAETIGDWNTGWGQGVAEYWTTNSTGDRLMINCGDRPMGPAVDVRISVNGHDIQKDKINRFVGFRIGAREGSLTYNENGRLNTFCVACISNYELFWQMLRNGKSVVFKVPNGMHAEFSLNGSAKALPNKSCITDVELAMHSPPKSAEIKAPVSNLSGGIQPNVAEKTSGSCKIEDWTYTEKAASIYLNGTTTCSSGKLIYRLYDGATGEFIASDFTYIHGFTFQSYTDGRVPKNLNIKYVIEER